MIYSVNLIAILAPIILVQYGLSLFCLVKLVLLDLPRKKFWLWNFFILIVVGIGVVTFLVCYFKFRDKVFPKSHDSVPETESEAQQTDAQSTDEADADTAEKTVFAAPEPPVEPRETPEQ